MSDITTREREGNNEAIRYERTSKEKKEPRTWRSRRGSPILSPVRCPLALIYDAWVGAVEAEHLVHWSNLIRSRRRWRRGDEETRARNRALSGGWEDPVGQHSLNFYWSAPRCLWQDCMHSARLTDTLGVVTQAQTGYATLENTVLPNTQHMRVRHLSIWRRTPDTLTYSIRIPSTRGTLEHNRRRSPDHQLPTLFGTKEELEALAEFVRKSNALQNQKTQTNRKEMLAAKQRDQRARGV